VWTVNNSDQIPIGYTNNPIWTDSVNVALEEAEDLHYHFKSLGVRTFFSVVLLFCFLMKPILLFSKDIKLNKTYSKDINNVAKDFDFK